MLAEWSAECTAEDPTLVVPWSSPELGAHFVNLRSEPYDIAEIHEAERFPAMGRALRALNATRSPFLTAKCDAWPLTSQNSREQLEAMRLELDLDPHEAHAGFGSYIDLIFRERTVFASAHQHSDRLDRVVRRAERLTHRAAVLQCVLRPAMLDLGTPLEGFAVTVYVSALGYDPETAITHWANALEDVVALLRHRDFEPARGSATIDS